MTIKLKKFLMYLFNIDLAREGKEKRHIYYVLYSCMVVYASVMTLTDALKFSKFSSFLFTTPKYKEVAEVILIFVGMILAIFMCLLLISILMHLTQKIVERIKKIWEK